MSYPGFTPQLVPPTNRTAFSNDIRKQFENIDEALVRLSRRHLNYYIADLNAYGGQNYYYRIPLPFSCKIYAVKLVIGANNATSGTAVWFYGVVNRQPAETYTWVILSTDVVGTEREIVFDHVNYPDAGTAYVPIDELDNTPSSPDSYIQIMTQGQGTSVMPGYVTVTFDIIDDGSYGV